MKNLYKIQDELYIVSNNEDISENCWIITSGKLVQVSYLLSDEVAKGFKVILTTDQDLIKDGVQAIDDEFLNWFVKNPGCEEVEVEKICNNCGDINCIHAICSSQISKNKGVTYKITIPKEEPKQCCDSGVVNDFCINTLKCKHAVEEPKQDEIDFMSKELDIEKERCLKQETVEEAAERF